MATSKKTSESVAEPRRARLSKALHEFLEATGYSKEETARLLNISTRSLFNYLGQAAGEPMPVTVEGIEQRLDKALKKMPASAQRQPMDDLRDAGWEALPGAQVMERDGEYVLVSSKGARVYPGCPTS